MCGICGIVNFSGEEVDENKLLTMRDIMINRGPDQGGMKIINGYVGFGHRRLSIIDLSENGIQPMSNEDGLVWAVFNGEIYNFEKLKKELVQAGHIFKSKTDTEVIIHGYEQWGCDVFEKLDGMFAIAIWDENTKNLILGRDRFGKKPLFCYYDDTTFYFASDIKSIRTAITADLAINPLAINNYLHHFSPTQDECIFQDINKVRPGHYQIHNMQNLSGDVTEFWSPSFKKKRDFTEDQVIEEIEQALMEAVRKRLISDVPLGAFLSGGVDSGMIVALMSEITGKPCKTFTIGFEEQSFSEISYAKKVAERYQTDHHEIILNPDVLDILPSMVWEFGEPFADSSAIPAYYVSKAARESVTVALSGDGGDEMFGGYSVARAAYYSEKFCRIVPEILIRPMYTLGSGKIKTLMTYASNDPDIRHSISMAFASADKEKLYTNEFISLLDGHKASDIFKKYSQKTRNLDMVDQALFYTNISRLPNDYLVKVDVASMKNSLEVRCPFLDKDLNTLCESIPSSLKVKNGQQKYLLKKLAEKYLPDEIIYKKKTGFELPISEWFKTTLGQVYRSMVLENGFLVKTGWFNLEYLKVLLDQHKTGNINHAHRLWSLLWLELWYRIFIEGSLKPGDSLKGIC